MFQNSFFFGVTGKTDPTEGHYHIFHTIVQSSESDEPPQDLLLQLEASQNRHTHAHSLSKYRTLLWETQKAVLVNSFTILETPKRTIVSHDSALELHDFFC